MVLVVLISCKPDEIKAPPKMAPPPPPFDWAVPLTPGTGEFRDGVFTAMSVPRKGQAPAVAWVREDQGKLSGSVLWIGQEGQFLDEAQVTGVVPDPPNRLYFDGVSMKVAHVRSLGEMMGAQDGGSSSYIMTSRPTQTELQLDPVKGIGDAALISFDGETVGLADETALRGLLEGRLVNCQYSYFGLNTFPERNDFSSNTMIKKIVAGQVGHWIAGGFFGPMLFDTAKLQEKPGSEIMGFVTLRDLFGQHAWGRQLGAQVPGKNRDWGATRALDIAADPGGYVWALWEGRSIYQNNEKAVLGVNMYDPNGVLLKNYVYYLDLPGGAEPVLQLLENGDVVVSSRGSDRYGKPVFQILALDREGRITKDTLIRLLPEEELLETTMDRDHLYYTVRDTVRARTGTDALYFLRRKSYR